MFDLTRRFLNCFKTTWVPMFCQVIIIALHLFWCHLFVHRFQWDLRGLALAQNLTSFTMFLSSTIIVNCESATKHALVWLDQAVLWTGWKDYFAMGVPITAITLAEHWAWQLLVIMSGILGVSQQAIMNITLQVSYILYAKNSGSTMAATVLVAHQIGANKVSMAKRYAKLIFLQGIFFATIFSTVILIFRE